MQFSYDKLNLLDEPATVLCNPDKTELYSLGVSYNKNLKLKYNALSEYSFDICSMTQNNVGENISVPAFDYIEGKRLVFIDEIGYFQIMKVTKNDDGTFPIKSVECTYLESELINKQVNAFSGTLKFYDPINNTNTFLGLVLSGTGWNIGDIDSDLWNIFRTFDIPSNNVYNTLMTTAETAYNCIFTFDTYNKLVNATSIDNATTNTDIFISYNNLIKNSKFSEVSEEIVTALSCFGGNGLDIRSVNPLGTNKIYNFSAYQNLNWMSQGLITAINLWQAKILANQTTYANLLTQLRTQNNQLSVLQSELSVLQDTLSGLLEVKKVRIEDGQSLTAINAQIAVQRLLITQKNTAITNKQTQITTTTNQIIAINNLLSFSNNFTVSQLNELRPFIIENSYQNENIVITDVMTPSQLQDQAQQLYDQAKDVHGRLAVARYEFDMETVNIIALKEFEEFTEQLELGCLVTVDMGNDVIISTALLEIDISFDNLDNFKMIFSNRLRLDNGSFQYSDLFGQVVNQTTNVAYNAGEWGNFQEHKSDLLTFIDSALDASRNAVVNAENEEILINAQGLQGRKSIGNGNFSDEQVWLTSNTLAFSDDGFTTAKLALGKLNFNGQELYGIIAEALIGDLIIGNQLIISNQNNTFRVDSSGATLLNATFTLDTTNGPNRTILSPNSGLSIIKKSNGSVVLQMTSTGDLKIKGDITADSGTFNGVVNATGGRFGNATQGLAINNTGLSTFNGTHFLKGDGTMSWGPLSITGPSSGSFSGTFSATKLQGQITNGQIGTGAVNNRTISELSANKINSGFIDTIDFFGGTIKWGNSNDDPNVIMYGQDGIGLIQAVDSIQLFIDTNDGDGVKSAIFLESGSNDTFSASMYVPAGSPTGSKGTIFIGIGQNQIKMSGILDLSSISTIKPSSITSGYTGTVAQNTSSGVRNFIYVKGILTSVT